MGARRLPDLAYPAADIGPPMLDTALRLGLKGLRGGDLFRLGLRGGDLFRLEVRLEEVE